MGTKRRRRTSADINRICAKAFAKFDEPPTAPQLMASTGLAVGTVHRWLNRNCQRIDAVRPWRWEPNPAAGQELVPVVIETIEHHQHQEPVMSLHLYPDHVRVSHSDAAAFLAAIGGQ